MKTKTMVVGKETENVKVCVKLGDKLYNILKTFAALGTTLRLRSGEE